MKVSVIIPTFNEASVIYETLEDLFEHHRPDEVIVVDGGSEDSTRMIARDLAHVMAAPKGRANQMNAGAEFASGDVYLFLHADTKLPRGGLEQIRKVVLEGKNAGRFSMRFDDRSWEYRFLESYTKLHWFSFGDQGFFVTREVFDQMGGFDPTVPFEDMDFYKRLRKVTRPCILNSKVVTSARRFAKQGVGKQKWINFALVGLYHAGFDIRNLQRRWYPDVR